MTRPAQTLQIAVSISAAMRFRDNVVNGFRLTHHTGTQAQLAQAFVTLQDTRADTVPTSNRSRADDGIVQVCIASSLRLCVVHSSQMDL